MSDRGDCFFERDKTLIYVNTRAIIERTGPDGPEILLQLRDKPYEGSRRLELQPVTSQPDWILGYRESPSLATWNKYIHPNDVAAAAEAEK